MPTILIRLLDLTCSLCAIFMIFKVLVSYTTAKRSRQKLLPPGPKGYPIVGNLFDMPAASKQSWKTFARWGEMYGGICSARVFGQTFIILNDYQIVHELLDIRGVKYSDRPQTVMSVLSGFGRTTTLMAYDDELKEHRKLMAQALGTPHLIKKFYPTAEHQSFMFLRRLLKNNRDLDQVIQKSTGAAQLSVAYGYNVKDEEEDDPFQDVVHHTSAMFGDILTPGRFIVDTLPFLQYIPPWFPVIPGINDFWKFADKARIYVDRLINDPMKVVHEQIASGRLPDCYVSDLLSDARSERELNSIAGTAATFYGAGTDTMKSVILSYFLAMTAHPQIQQRLHDEIDSVIGGDRLPTIQDRDSLPYLQAVFKECFRWLPALPTGVVHQTNSDDVYEGYFIPKGSIVIVNAWKLLHDPETYSNPKSFNPDRFLGPNSEKDPFTYAFGFGRRICPGIHLADVIVWSYLAKTAAALRVTRDISSDGQEIDPICDQTAAIVSQPVTFSYRIIPRHDEVYRLIEEGI